MGRHSTKLVKCVVYQQDDLVECLKKTLPTFYQHSTKTLTLYLRNSSILSVQITIDLVESW